MTLWLFLLADYEMNEGKLYFHDNIAVGVTVYRYLSSRPSHKSYSPFINIYSKEMT